MIGLRLGDCLDILPTLASGSVDAVVTDPPYGARRPSAWRLASEQYSEIEGNDAVHDEWLSEAYRVTKDTGAIYVFTCWDMMEVWRRAINKVGFRVRSCIVWDKCVHGLGDVETCYAPQHEMILFGAKGRHIFRGRRPKDIIRTPRLQADRLTHPYEKPIGIYYPLITASVPLHGTVLDCFMGSGSSGHSAINEGRNFIGIESSAEYFEIAKRRIEQAQMQPQLALTG